MAGEATLRLSRTWSGIGIGGQYEVWKIEIDGTVVGAIANRETVEVQVEPGRHALRLGSGRHLRPKTLLRCHGGRGRELSLPRSKNLAAASGGGGQTRSLGVPLPGLSAEPRAGFELHGDS